MIVTSIIILRLLSTILLVDLLYIVIGNHFHVFHVSYGLNQSIPTWYQSPYLQPPIQFMKGSNLKQFFGASWSKT